MEGLERDGPNLARQLKLRDCSIDGLSRLLRLVPGEGAHDPAIASMVLRLIMPDCPLSFRRSAADTIFFFHQGSGVGLTTVSDQRIEHMTLGKCVGRGDCVQATVPRGTWFAVGPPATRYALVSEVRAPGLAADRDERSSAARLGVRLDPVHAPAPPSTLTSMGLVERLNLAPLGEGGYFRQTFESAEMIHTLAGIRPLMTVIYYLLTDDSPIGYLHRNRSAITHFHHAGSPARYLLLSPAGRLAKLTLGSPDVGGAVPVFTAPGGWWKASHLPTDVGPVGPCLLSEAVAPGFRFDDHSMATADVLAAHPGHSQVLRPWVKL